MMQARGRLAAGALLGALVLSAPMAGAGLVAYYSFDNSGNLGQDTSGSGYHASNSGATYDAAGYFGGAARFAGSNEYLQLPSNPLLDNLQNLPGYTIAAWVRADQVPPGSGSANDAHYGIIEKAGYHSGLRYTNVQTFAMDAWRVGDVNVSVSSPPGSPYPPLAWHHVLSTVNKTTGTLRIYVDGSLVGTTSFAPGTDARNYGTTPWRIGIANPGASSYRWPMDGMIDDAALWNVILPDELIQRLGAGTAQPLNTPVPVGRLEAFDHANVGTAAYAHDPITGEVYGPVHWKLERLNHTFINNKVRSEWYLGYQATSQAAFLGLATSGRTHADYDLPFIAWGNASLPNKYPPETPYSGDMSTFSTRYWGQVYIPPATGNPGASRAVRFREFNDDYTLFVLDGTVYLFDSAWTDFFGAGGDGGKIISLTLTPGWHDLEYYQSEGGGGDNARLLWDYDPLTNTFGGANPFITVGSDYYRYSVPELLAEGWYNVGGPAPLNGIFYNIGSAPGETFQLRLTVDYLGSSAVYEATFFGVPEPATALLLAGGLMALARRRRK